jgi:magnesium and cobalt transporter
MSDDPSSPGSGAVPAQRTWLERLSQALSGEPRNRDELLEELRTAQANGLVSTDTLAMMEGAIAVSDKQVADVMVPRARMVTIPATVDLASALRIVVDSGHSRFPVTGEDRDEIVGILLAKDLLKCFRDGALAGTPCDLKALWRRAAMIPETKRLNVLLKEFRASRQHMAIVVNEFGGVAGLVTIEDVLEEIVGDIADEHDDDEPGSLIQSQNDGRFLVHALTPIADFNERFGTHLPDDEFDTVGGMVTATIGHLPGVGEECELDGLAFRVTKSDSRRVHQLAVRVTNAA